MKHLCSLAVLEEIQIMKNLIKDTWLAGVMLISSILGKKKKTKSVEIHAEDYHTDETATKKNESNNV